MEEGWRNEEIKSLSPPMEKVPAHGRLVRFLCKVLYYGTMWTGLLLIGVLAIPAGLLVLVISGLWTGINHAAAFWNRQSKT